MYLLIDTMPDYGFDVGLADGKGFLKSSKKRRGSFIESEELLPAIQDLLKDCKSKLQDLEGIAVIKGRGGFTSVRAGISTANALGYGLGIPVFGVLKDQAKSLRDLAGKIPRLSRTKKEFSLVKPVYGKPPNITRSKKKPF